MLLARYGLIPALVLASQAWGTKPGGSCLPAHGVKEIAQPNYIGALCVFGDLAFPVVNGRAEHETEEPVIAAARFRKGRMVALTGYLESELWAIADTSRMMLNIGRWAAGEKKAPRAGVYNIPGLASQLRTIGLDARDITLSERSTVDVIFVVPRVVNDADVPILIEYAGNGGGVVDQPPVGSGRVTIPTKYWRESSQATGCLRRRGSCGPSTFLDERRPRDSRPTSRPRDWRTHVRPSKPRQHSRANCSLRRSPRTNTHSFIPR